MAIRYSFIAKIAPARPFRWSADAAEMGASQTKQHCDKKMLQGNSIKETFNTSSLYELHNCILEKRARIKLKKTWNENTFKIQLEVGRVSFLL